MASSDRTRKSPGAAASSRRGLRDRVRHRVEAAREKYVGSTAEHLWHRLDAMDFINRGMLFAATLLLCLIPFFIIVNALAGRSATSELVRRLGLNQQAAADVSRIVAPSSATSSAITGISWVFFVLGGIAAGSAVQGLYQRAFELDPRGASEMLRRVAWLAVVVGAFCLIGWVAPGLRHAVGPVLLGVTGLVVFTGFWWFTMWFLLAGRISWRNLFPSAVATGVFWLGMEAVFSIIFSGMVISYDKKYGTVGVVFALMSYLIAIGIVIILGAVVGIVWQERNLSFRAAFKKLKPNRSAPKATRP